MEPKSTVSRKDEDHALPPPTRPPIDVEDYFELAYETDEFGTHVPEFLAAR
jgi:hypothetical protein